MPFPSSLLATTETRISADADVPCDAASRPIDHPAAVHTILSINIVQVIRPKEDGYVSKFRKNLVKIFNVWIPLTDRGKILAFRPNFTPIGKKAFAHVEQKNSKSPSE